MDRIGIDDNFFDLGASSILLTRAHVALEAVLDRAVLITAMFEHPTVRRLAAYVAGQNTHTEQPKSRRSIADLRARRLAARAKEPW